MCSLKSDYPASYVPCNKTRTNSQTKSRINASVLNTIFTTAIYKNAFVTKGFSTDIYTVYMNTNVTVV